MVNAYDALSEKAGYKIIFQRLIAIRLKYMHLKSILQGTLENENRDLGNRN